MSRQTTCAICDKPTIDQHLNESYDMWEYICESCAPEFNGATRLPNAGDLEDCNLTCHQGILTK